MQVTVEYAAQVKRAAGCASETVQLEPPCTLQKCLAQVAACHGDGLGELLFDSDGKLHRSILVFVRDEQVRWDQPVELENNDTITILSPISGG